MGNKGIKKIIILSGVIIVEVSFFLIIKPSKIYKNGIIASLPKTKTPSDGITSAPMESSKKTLKITASEKNIEAPPLYDNYIWKEIPEGEQKLNKQAIGWYDTKIKDMIILEVQGHEYLSTEQKGSINDISNNDDYYRYFSENGWVGEIQLGNKTIQPFGSGGPSGGAEGYIKANDKYFRVIIIETNNGNYDNKPSTRIFIGDQTLLTEITNKL